MKNYTITVNGVAYEVTVEEGFTGAAAPRCSCPCSCHPLQRDRQRPHPHRRPLHRQQLLLRRLQRQHRLRRALSKSVHLCRVRFCPLRQVLARQLSAAK